jgi:hypothetical protein
MQKQTLKQYIEAAIAQKGYAVVRMSKLKSSALRLGNCNTWRAVQRLGYASTNTLGYMGIAKTQEGARAACYWAAYRGAVKRYDAATEFQRSVMLRRA